VVEVSTRGPAYLNVLDYTDTELGAAVRAAHADGHLAILLIPRDCPICERPLKSQETCPACGDPDERPEPADLPL
jgi:hypothetical protein